MTPTQIEDAARRAYNAVGSSFWSQSEILDLIYFAEMELCRKAHILRRTYTATTVASTQDYSFPTYVIGIKKITWDGVPLKRVDLREDDILTGNDADTTSTGSPRYYFDWGRTVSLRPIPSSAATLKLWTYDEPSTLSSTSTLDVATKYHPDIILYLLGHMVAKDENFRLSENYLLLWEKKVQEAIKEIAKTKRMDSFAYVKDEEALMDTTTIGVI